MEEKEQTEQAIVCYAGDLKELNKWLERGWKVKFCVPESISAGSGEYHAVEGRIVFVIVFE